MSGVCCFFVLLFVFFSPAGHFFSVYAVVKTVAGHLVPYQRSKWQLVFFSIHFQVQHLYFRWALWHPAVDFSIVGSFFVAAFLFTILLFLNAVTRGKKKKPKEKLKLHFRWQPPENFFKSQSIPVANGNINSFLPRRAFYQNRKDDVQTFFFLIIKKPNKSQMCLFWSAAKRQRPAL